MYCSIKSNAMLSLRIVLAAIMSLFVLVCFAQPAAPQVNIEIMVIDGVDRVKLSWEPVAGAESYNIYASPVVNPEDWGDPLATVGDSVFSYITEDSFDELGSAYFFYVTAYAEEELMVLVDGDLFNGTVTIDPFYISKYQVTRAEFRDIMGADWEFTVPNPGAQPEPTDNNYPANRISWFDAVEYCNRLSIREGLTPAYSYLGRSNPDDWYDQWPGWNGDNDNHTNISCDWEVDGYRLPTEAEWHHAANGAVHDPESEWPFGSPYRFAGSNDIDEVAWYSGNAGGTTHPVGGLAPNGLGIYDMSGNVFEWVWDRRGGAFPSGNDNPRGDGTHATSRVLRGGRWNGAAAQCAVSFRSNSTVTVRFSYVGFRVARNAPPPPEERMVLVDGDLFNGTVTIDPFYISKYQVTQEDFVDVMGEWDFHFGGNPTNPAEMVSWFDAVEYCNRLSIREGLTPCYSYDGFGNTDPDNWPPHADRDHLLITCDWNAERSNGYRLPTEAEWNHAANSGIHPPPFTYSGSDDIDEVAWYFSNSGFRPRPVGTKAPNGLGIYDMSGNVWEWCWDIHGGPWPPVVDNPRGADVGANRVVRGGRWIASAADCTVSWRGVVGASIRLNALGFRVVRIIP